MTSANCKLAKFYHVSVDLSQTSMSAMDLLCITSSLEITFPKRGDLTSKREMRRQIRLVAGSKCPKWSGTDKTEVSLRSVEQRNTSNTSGQLHIRRGLLERRFHAKWDSTLVIDMRGRTITVPKIRCLCTPLYSQSRTWVECFSPHSASLIIALGSASFISSARARVSAARIY